MAVRIRVAAPPQASLDAWGESPAASSGPGCARKCRWPVDISGRSSGHSSVWALVGLLIQVNNSNLPGQWRPRHGAWAGSPLAVMRLGNRQNQDCRDYRIFRMTRRKGRPTQSCRSLNPANPGSDERTVESGRAGEVNAAADSLPAAGVLPCADAGRGAAQADFSVRMMCAC